MVHGMEDALVEHLNVFGRVFHVVSITFYLVNIVERNLHTARSRSQHFSSSSGTVTSRAYKVEDAWAIQLHKVIASILCINVVEKVTDEMCQYLRTVVVRGCELEVHIRCGEIEPVLHLYVVGYEEVVVEPLVKGVCSLILVHDGHVSVKDALGEVILAAA